MVDCEAVTRDISAAARTLSKAAVDKVSSALLRCAQQHYSYMMLCTSYYQHILICCVRT
jgi:hypothetical protein